MALARELGRGGAIALAVILVLGGAIRVAYVLEKWDDPPRGDAIYYTAQAETLAAGEGFQHPFTGESAADHPPLTSLLVAPASLRAGDNFNAQRLTMAAVGVLVIVAIAALGAEVGGRRVALVAAALAAAYPGLWINDGLVMSETPTALVTALLLLAAMAWRRGAFPSWALGALGGVAVLTRAELALLVVLLVMPQLVRRAPHGRHEVRGVAVVLGVAALFVAPWTIRNVVRFEEPVLVSTNDGLTLIGANCDPSYYDGVGFWHLGCAPPVDGDLSEVSAAYRRMAFSYVGDHLDRVPAVVAARVGRVWSVWRPNDMILLNQGEDREPWASRAALWTWWALAPATVAGLVLLRRRRRPVWPLVAPAITVTLTAAAFYGIVRFRLPFEVVVPVASAVAICEVVRAARGRRARAVAP